MSKDKSITGNRIYSQKDILIMLAKMMKNNLALLVLCIILSAVFVVCSLYIPKLVGDCTDMIVGKGNVDFNGLYMIITKIAVVTIVAGLAQWVMSLCSNKMTYNVTSTIRKKAFDRIQHIPFSVLDEKSPGDIVSRIIADTDQLADGLLMGFTQLFTGVITILLTIIFMLRINWRIAIVVIIMTPLSMFLSAFIAKRTYAMFGNLSKARGEQTALIEESFQGASLIKEFGMEDKIQSDFDRINDDLAKYYEKATFYSAFTNPGTRFINNIIYAIVALVGGLASISSGFMTVGGLVTVLSYSQQYAKPFNEISGVITELQNAIACAGRVFEIINAKVEEDKGIVSLTDDSKVPAIKDESFTADGTVEIKDVAFSYDKSKKLIENLSLDVKRGQRIAIVGPTGSGKTTLINLLMRFYDPDKGVIIMGNKDIKTISRHSLRENIGMVLQETWLRSGTIKENITLGKNYSDEEIKAAAKKSHAHSFIRRLPKGYDTVISEDGEGLSQGQKQLLCITRVMLNVPPMLILDEATSSIDTRTELKIQDAFCELMRGRTSFVVAHRLSTVKSSDCILVMKDGKIIEQGNHKSLLEKKGFYYELYNSQI